MLSCGVGGFSICDSGCSVDWRWMETSPMGSARCVVDGIEAFLGSLAKIGKTFADETKIDCRLVGLTSLLELAKGLEAFADAVGTGGVRGVERVGLAVVAGCGLAVAQMLQAQ